MLVEFTVNGNEAVGKVVDPGAAKRYGFVKGEEVFRLTADSYGDWVGKTRWRSVTGAQHWAATTRRTPDLMTASAHGPVRPWCEHGSKLM